MALVFDLYFPERPSIFFYKPLTLNDLHFTKIRIE